MNIGNRVHQECYGNLTATILKARWLAANPFEEEFDPLDLVDAVHEEWAKMSPEAHKAQMEIIAALEQSHWTEEDWETYRDLHRP